MGVQEELERLYSLKEHKIKLGLEPTFKALEKLDDPQKNLRVVHITGTNGKGSVSAMVADTLQRAGYKVGLFTSPHLVKFNERIQINRKEITNDELVKLIEKVGNTGVQLTFFEYGTVMALQHFYDNKVDFVIFEVGLGGMLDSTNVVDAEIAAITDISLDHMNYLGNTIEEIATDKSGIIKKQSKVVTCVDNAGIKWIKEKCESQGNQLFLTNPYEGKIGLKGEFQKINAGIAKKVCELLEIEEAIIEEGIATTQWPARLEFVESNVLIDCAHNPAAIKAVKPYIDSLPKKKLILIFGSLRGKNHEAMIKELPEANTIILTKPWFERGANPDDLPFNQEVIIKEDPKKAYEYAKSIAGPDDLILVVGSIYLAGNIKEVIQRS